MKSFRIGNLFIRVARWQILTFAVAVLLFVIRMQGFLQCILDSFIMTNSIGIWIHIIIFLLEKKYKFSRLTARGKVTFWVVLILTGTILGTFLGFFFLAIVYKQTYINFIKTDFLPIFYFCLFLGVVYSIGIIVYNSQKERIENKARENEELKHLQVRTHLMALQAKLNPHFLFNTLNTILNLVYKHPEKVETMILNLSDIYRRVLKLPEDQFVPLKEELHLVKEYLEIEKIRLGDRLDYTINADSQLGNMQIPPLLIEPVVENAVFHGISPKLDSGTIKIEVDRKEKFLSIKITDDGVGMKSEKLQSCGFGLHSVQERMRLIYKGHAQFRINLVPTGGTCITLELPLEWCDT